MARPLRIEYPNAVYHVMNRGKSLFAPSEVGHGKKEALLQKIKTVKQISY
jgi:hypothetical protein